MENDAKCSKTMVRPVPGDRPAQLTGILGTGYPVLIWQFQFLQSPKRQEVVNSGKLQMSCKIWPFIKLSSFAFVTSEEILLHLQILIEEKKIKKEFDYILAELCEAQDMLRICCEQFD